MIQTAEETVALLDEDYSGLRPGLLGEHLDGAYREMHAQPVHQLDNMDGWQHKTGDWGVPTERWSCVDGPEGRCLQSLVTCTTWQNNSLAKGSVDWSNYQVSSSLRLLKKEDGWGGPVGIIFRFLDSTRFYALVIDDDGDAKLIRSSAINNYDVLTRAALSASDGYDLQVDLSDGSIKARINEVTLYSKDASWDHGMVGLLGNQPAAFGPLRVYCDAAEWKSLLQRRTRRHQRLNSKRQHAGQPELYRQIDTTGFGSGRRMRLGDLTGDGQLDFVHTRLDPSREPGVASIVAQGSSGEVLWQRGQLPDIPEMETSGDAALQIHDINDDGYNEVICAMNHTLYILDGLTGTVKQMREVPPPLTVSEEYKRNLNTWGECFDDLDQGMPCIALTLVDFQGIGKRTDIVLSGHHHQTMVFNNKLELLWQGIYCHGHYPIPYRPKGSRFDQLLNGYHHLNHKGERLGRVCMMDHQDAIFVGPLDEAGEGPDQILMAAGEDGLLHMTPSYHVRQRHMGHVQRLSIGKFRSDIPGQCIATVLFHGNRGVVSMYDSTVKHIWTRDFPVIGATLQPVLFDDSGEERMLLSGIRPAQGYQGGLIDGHGDMVSPLPDDGGPGLCAMAQDFDGDGLDELMLWDHERLWLYHSNCTADRGALMNRVRPPLYNMSNFQSYYSLPAGAIEEI